MIVEFIGTTGSGKSTLISHVQQNLIRHREVTTSSDLVTGLAGLQGIRNTTARNILQETIGFPYFIGALPNYKDFINHSINLFSRNTPFSMYTINNLRSIERKLGGLEIAKRYESDKIILVDEGPILITHMFAFNETEVSSPEMDKYVRMLPLPDVLIYVKANIETLMERSLNRVSPPREMRARDGSENKEYILRAASLFDQIIEKIKDQTNLLIVDNSSNNKDELDETVNQISNFILAY